MIKQQRVKKRRITLPSPALPSPTSIISSFKQQPLPEEHSIKRRRTTPKKNNANTESSSIGKYKERNVFKSMEKQQEFMEELFYKLSFARMEEWLSLSSNKFIQHGGKRLIITQYKRDMKTLLSSIYPNYCWEFDNRKQTSPPLSSLNNQQKRMEELFVKLKLQRMEDWVKVKRRTFNKSGGKQLLLLYNRNFQTLLLSLYPNYPWHYHCNLLSSNLPSLSPNPPSNLPSLSFNLVPKEHFQSIENQREFMRQLFIKYSLKTIDDWLSFSRHKIIQNGGRSLLNYYKGDFSLLLQCIYPNYPMEDIKSLSLKFKSHHYFRSKENQREFMHHLYNKLKLKSLNHWLKVKTKIIKENGGINLLKEYKNEKEKILFSLFPNFPWSFVNKTQKNNEQNYKIDDEIIKKFDQLFIKLKLKSFDDWSSVSYTKIIKWGGKKLLLLSNANFIQLLQKVYPNFPWLFSFSSSQPPKRFFKSIENQKQFFDHLFVKFKLKSLDGWLNIKRIKMKKNGGKKLLKRYDNDMKRILFSIYPNYPWTYQIYSPLISSLIVKYNITQKKDWYRLKYKNNLFSALKLFYPSEKWKKSNFISRSKKITQRLLFSFTRMIYPSLLIFENYFHPKLIPKQNTVGKSYELDIFIPALQLALEYQGQQHYDDLPSGFGACSIELNKERDVEKEKLASSLHIKIINIPYWWDLSLSSLLSSIQSS